MRLLSAIKTLYARESAEERECVDLIASRTKKQAALTFV
jgi:hypothetical protein